MLTRRQFLVGTATGIVAAAYGPRVAFGQTGGGGGGAGQEITLTATATSMGSYLYLPFDVPEGVNRIDVKITKAGGDATTGVGLFDERGTAYQRNGFRGIYGEERSEFFVAAHDASQSFMPGTINAGRWTVIVPVFRQTVPTVVTATVRLSFGPQLAAVGFGPEPGVVRAEPGWYRGDLHCHTPESSDAWKSGSALSPKEWASEARRVGLDFVALTDHNVITQNLRLLEDAGPDVLLIAGEEMTNWFHGHATVSGIAPGDWLDWRQTPLALPLPTGGVRISEFMTAARSMGGYVAAAHPLGPGAGLPWTFIADGDADPAARPDGLEVWTGQFQPDDEASVRLWDEVLARGWRVWANGGTDLHGTKNDQGFVYGTPTTVVYADALSKPAIVAALKRGRSYVTRTPDGVELYLAARGTAGQAQIVGGTIYGEAGDSATVEVLVRRAGGMRLIVLHDGVPVSVTPITADDQRITTSVPIGAGGYVRAEVRSQVFVDPTKPLAGRLDMEALTNPIFLVRGPVPPGTQPETLKPPPPRGEEARPAGGGGGGRSLPPTGGGGAVRAGAVAGVAAMTMTELVLRSRTGAGLEATVRLQGEVTASGVLTRWVPDRCGDHDHPVDVRLHGHDVLVGEWLEVEGRWVPGTTDPPELVVDRLRPLDEPLPRREV